MVENAGTATVLDTRGRGRSLVPRKKEGIEASDIDLAWVIGVCVMGLLLMAQQHQTVALQWQQQQTCHTPTAEEFVGVTSSTTGCSAAVARGPLLATSRIVWAWGLEGWGCGDVLGDGDGKLRPADPWPSEDGAIG
ncbi:hypothetical protein UY3_02486 [Chelonia mydas]|uniref:Uncharacterized protein n=1 Tax=Chelonia mydas TaxID=8469 RepID=M7C738_CHEMY|nr:hypothetical protein UY3_02486 [Chelonia mydas]